MLKQIEREVTNPLLLVRQINKIYVDYVTTWEFVGVMSNRSWFWNPPLPPFLKVNFDASINEEKNCIATMGRNHKGEIIFVDEAYERPRPFDSKSKSNLSSRKKSSGTGV